MEGRRPPDTLPEDSEQTAAASQTAGRTETALDGARPQKRRKISNACEPCRARKTRCDGEKPICGPCRYRSNSPRPCRYAKDVAKGMEQQEMTTRSLVDRIQSLERVIASSWPQAPAQVHGLGETQRNQGTSQSTPSPSACNEAVHVAISSPSASFPRPPSQAVVHDVANPNRQDGFGSSEAGSPIANYQKTVLATEAENSASPVNAMGSTAFMEMGTKLPLSAAGEFYGGSSAARFMQQVEEAIPDTGPQRSCVVQPGGSQWNASGANSRAEALNLVLPTRDLADALLENYFAKSHSLYPFVYRPIFTRAYEDMWKPSHELKRGTTGCDLGLGTPGLSDSQSIVFHCALNAVFALSCQLSDPVIQLHGRESLSQTFFARCRSLLHVDILDHGTIALVQTLLIIAQYLQSTSFPSRCWTSLGLACRIGQGLGLHVEDCVGGLQRDAREVELRRRVWYGCTIMDIVASATLGRPMMTPDRITIPLPSMTADGESGELEDALSRSTFYVATIRLYLILGKILSTVYNPWPVAGSEGEKYGDTEAVISLDEELTIFEESVEECLHWERGTAISVSLPAGMRHIVQRQANVLHARFLHARLLLHRPTFLRLCRKMALSIDIVPSSTQNTSTERQVQKEKGFRSKIDIHSSSMCVENAIQLINSLSESTIKQCAGAWWYTTYYLCTAGTVLVLARACSAMHKHFNIDKIHEAWTLCCATLQKLVESGHPVKHALRGLCNLYQKFVGDSLEACPIPSAGLDIDATRQVPPSGEPDNVEDSILHRPESPQDRHQSPFQSESAVHNTESTANVQPLMDFMTHDINLVPFGLIDEEWWRLQHGDWDLDFRS